MSRLVVVVVAVVAAALTAAASSAAADTAAPKIAISTPASGATVRGTFTVSGTASDAAGLSRVEVRVDRHPYVVASGRRSWRLGIDAGSYRPGSHVVTVRATDRAGRRAGVRRSYRFSARAHGIYWGAWVGDQFTGTQAPWDMGAARAFEAIAGKGMSLIHFSSPFANCSSGACSFYGFPAAAMSAIRSHGSIPFFSWASTATPHRKLEPNFELRDVAAGDYDGYIRSFAVAARNWGHPFFLQFNFEMNGDWFPWGVGTNHNTALDFIASWRRVHDIFTSVGANNATWVWCPNVDYDGAPYPSLLAVYPGDAYVDWTCLDGYNWGTNPKKPNHWMSFSQRFSWTYNELMAVAPSKPVVLGEVASSEDGGSKAAWIKDMLTTQLPRRFPKIRGFVWMEKYDGNFDWPIETSKSSQAAFAAAIKNPIYAGNKFATLGGTKITPPH